MTACPSLELALSNRGLRKSSSSLSSDIRGAQEARSPSGVMVPDRRDGDWTLRKGDHKLSPCHRESGKLLTLPTILTLGRVAAVPLLVCTFYIDNWSWTTATSFIFILAAITDWLDGCLARKMKLGSVLFWIQLPIRCAIVIDKLMVAATLIMLCTKPVDLDMLGKVPWLLHVPANAIIGREITMSAVREWAASQSSRFSEAVAVNSWGKWKTATQMTALTTLLIARDSRIRDLCSFWCILALSLSMASCMVIICIHGEDLDSFTKLKHSCERTHVSRVALKNCEHSVAY